MPLLVADCPRCGAAKMTFEITAHVFREQEHGWLNRHEVFSICRRCARPTTFVIALSIEGRHFDLAASDKLSRDKELLMKLTSALNPWFEVERYVSLRDNVPIQPPEHLPDGIASIFREGAACLSIGCHNAAGTMFRLCLDLATKPLLPPATENTTPQPNGKQRRDLGLRLAWLFDNGRLPVELKALAQCVREDANDGAHAGTLTKLESEDLLDFTEALLERLISEPKRLELAAARRDERRKSK